jgi:transcriptional regulator with XRE-family HTH domain
MSIENSEIALLIQNARKEKNIPQKQIAQQLHKTTVAISDLERGKVKISAAELSKIAEILNKPIEYFFGESIGDQEIQDMVTIIRRTSPEQKQDSLNAIKMIFDMQEAADSLMENPDQPPSTKDAKRFINAYLDFRDYVTYLTGLVVSWGSELERVLKEQGIEFSRDQNK